MEKLSPHNLILKTLKEKSSMKQDVYNNTFQTFRIMKSSAKQIVEEIKREIADIDKRIIIEYREKGEFEFELRIAGDLLIFSMHTNVFEFDKAH